MSKFKIFLYGTHSNRTPFSYEVYRYYFEDYFEYVSTASEADFLVTGFNKDLKDNFSEIQLLKNKNPSLKLVVLSEEPLWDTLWGDDFYNKKATIEISEKKLEYYNANHVTSDIFDFIQIPYFITTTNDFFIRYRNMFLKNIKSTTEDIKKNWTVAKYKYSFFAAKRISEKSCVKFDNGKIIGLNRIRSLIAEGLESDKILIEGAGWSVKEKRQLLPDWHLDKLAKLNRNSYIVSSLENTHLENYISEKIFDAFAVLAIPIYYAMPFHRVYDIINEHSFINVASLSISEAIKRIEDFILSDEFIKAYKESQERLAILFSDHDTLVKERIHVVNKTINFFRIIKKENK